MAQSRSVTQPAKLELSVSLLRELISYEPETGLMTWRARTRDHFRDGVLSAQGAASIWNGQHAGRPALSYVDPDGYKSGSVLGRAVHAHRIAYAIHHGSLPSGPVAHLNGERGDNRISNLRAGTAARSSKGAGGVRRVGHRWVARICVSKRREYLGTFSTQQQANDARDAAWRRHGFLVPGEG